MNFTDFIKKFNLIEWYLQLTPVDKETVIKYSPMNNEKNFQQYHIFQINSPAAFLWVTGANLIPQNHYLLAECCLLKALEIDPNIEDSAHIFSNLAQLYYDLWLTTHSNMDSFGYDETRYQYLCRYYCNRTIETGYFETWANNLLSTLETASVEWI